MQRFVAVGRVHLIGFLVAAFQITAGTERIAERAIVARRIFGGVSHDLSIHQTLMFQAIADRADTAVHHVTRCHDLCPGFRVRQRLTNQDLFGDVVNDITLFVNNAVLTVSGVGIERHVRQNTQLRHRVFQCTHRTLYQTFRVISFFRMQ
ncbi:hypothetical protein D3C78_1035220 [compost metagenome]